MENKLRPVHYRQLLSYAESAARNEWYYGNKANFIKRHGEIVRFLNDEVVKFKKIEAHHDT